jgi:predicted O-methyltransferase YrrM
VQKRQTSEPAARMNDHAISQKPEALAAIHKDTEALGFTMASEPQTGALLAALAASKPGGRLLELGTGTGVGTPGFSPKGHAPRVPMLIEALVRRPGFTTVKLSWASGLMLVVRTS